MQKYWFLNFLKKKKLFRWIISTWLESLKKTVQDKKTFLKKKRASLEIYGADRDIPNTVALVSKTEICK
jgi:hypothetical protein